MSALLEQHRCADLIREGTTVLDIGASVGDFAIEARDKGAFVWCVEPYGPNVEWLMDRRLVVLPVAAGKVDGWAELAVPDDPSVRATGCFTYGDRPDAEDWDDGPPGGVRVLSLASLLAAAGQFGIDIVKVDIEGGEYDLFDGADTDTMQRVGFVTIECHAWTAPGEARSQGIGERAGPRYATGAMLRLFTKLMATHGMNYDGDLDDGGCVMWGTRRV